MKYNFGLYHWRRRLRSIAKSIIMAGISVIIGKISDSRINRSFAAVVGGASIIHAASVVIKLLFPLPWKIERETYDKLAQNIVWSSNDRVLDIGCGTGRSLVGLAPYIPSSCLVIGIDVFTDEIISGNTPIRAQNNIQAAGKNATTVIADAVNLPFANETQDIITISRVLHDIPAMDAQRTLEEARRVCSTNGTLGVIELPIPHDRTVDPCLYWESLVTNVGFTIETVNYLPWKGGKEYIIITASPTQD